MIERLKICWYALTKKYYAFFAYDKEIIGKGKSAKCYISDNAENSKIFIGALNDYSKKRLKDLCSKYVDRFKNLYNNATEEEKKKMLFKLNEEGFDIDSKTKELTLYTPKDGDIVCVYFKDPKLYAYFGIFKEEKDNEYYFYILYVPNAPYEYLVDKKHLTDYHVPVDDITNIRFATENEKEEALSAMRRDGFDWVNNNIVYINV